MSKTENEVTQVSQDIAQGLNMHGVALNQASFQATEMKLQLTSTGEDMFKDDEDDGAKKTIEQASIVSSFTAAVVKTVEDSQTV